jgi:hypothetical protein
MVLFAAVCRVCGFCLILVSFGHYDEPEVLLYAIPLMCPIGYDVKQSEPLSSLRGGGLDDTEGFR